MTDLNLQLQHVEAFRTVYALNDILKTTGMLKASHYACVLQYGRSPIWGVFSAHSGKLIHLASGKDMINKLHPGKTWRVKQATWSLGNIIASLDAEAKVAALEAQVEKTKPRGGKANNVIPMQKAG